MNATNENTTAITPETKFEIAGDVSWREVDGQIVCMHLDSGEYFTFNKSARVLWLELTGGKSVRETSKTLQEKYGIDAERAEQDTLTFLRSLLESELVHPA